MVVSVKRSHLATKNVARQDEKCCCQREEWGHGDHSSPQGRLTAPRAMRNSQRTGNRTGLSGGTAYREPAGISTNRIATGS